MTDGARQDGEAEAATKLGARAALLSITSRELAKANALWREHALAAGDDLTRERQVSRDEARERERLGKALAGLGGLPRRARFHRLGEMAGHFARAPAWALAVDEGNGLTLKASFGLRSLPALGLASALYASYDRRATIVRRATVVSLRSGGEAASVDRVEAPPPTSTKAEVNRRHDNLRTVADLGRRAWAEDVLLLKQGFAAYVVVPFARGAIMLAHADRQQLRLVSRVRAFIAAAEPTLNAWLLEEEVERYRALVRRLGLRMLNAADLERARIARELHDDQAQLLAAIKLALGLPKTKAKSLVAQVERELRGRVSALRPLPVGRISLKGAIERELERLRAAGIKAKLLSDVSERALNKTVRHTCFQVVREALANVARHAVATEVTVRMERRDGALVLDVTNDGVETRGAMAGKGVGLTGLNERLALLGGNCRFIVGRRKSRLLAEIPYVRR
jgi:signal transduction histidine kinase